MNAPLKQAASVQTTHKGFGVTMAAKETHSPKETVLAMIARQSQDSEDESFTFQQEQEGQSQSLDAPLKQGALRGSSNGGFDNSHVSNGDYLPSGVLLATILKALRNAEDNQLKIQQEQAQTEQNYYKALGGLNGDISKGIIAMAASSVVQAGSEEASGLEAQGVASAVSAGLTGATTVGTLGVGGWNTYKEGGIQDEIDQTKDFGKQLDGPKQADFVIAEDKLPTDEKLNQLVDSHGKNADGSYDQEAIEAIKLNPEKLKSTKAQNDEKLEDLQKKQKDLGDSTSRWVQNNQAISQVVNSATNAAGSIKQSQAKAAAAVSNASAQVQKQVQDMNYSAANTFKENAKSAAQQALQAADTMAQVAQSQVQFRG